VSSDNGLPDRAGFEEATPRFRPRPAGPSHRELSGLREALSIREVDGLAIPYFYTQRLPDGRLFFSGARFRGHSVPPLREFVTRFRTELGFRDGDWPEFVGRRVFRRYANGAISLRYLSGQYPELPYELPDDGRPVESYSSLLPPPADGLSAPPDLTGEQALATVHDMNPYLTFIPLEEPGRSLAARLVVVSGVDWDPRLAWEVRYRFSCWESGVGKEKPYLVEDSAYAYVDARAGSLVFGRDTTRGGAMLNGPNWVRPMCFGFCCTFELRTEPKTPAPKAPAAPARRR